MGIGTNEKPIGAPTQVLKGNAQTEGNYLTGISTIAVGHRHMLAIQSIVINDSSLTADQLEAAQQKVWGWGSNSNYQLTQGPVTENYTTGQYHEPILQYAAPVTKDGVTTQTHLYGVKAVEAGVNTSAAVNRIDKSADNMVLIDPARPELGKKYIRNAELYAWGDGNLGQLGDGNSKVHNVTYPLFTQDGETAEHIAGGDVLDTSVDTQGYKVTEHTGNLTEVKYISLGYNHASDRKSVV